MTQKLICRVCWWPGQYRRFQNDVNSFLIEGWVCRDMSVIPRLFRLVCLALLESPEPLPVARKR